MVYLSMQVMIVAPMALEMKLLTSALNAGKGRAFIQTIKNVLDGAFIMIKLRFLQCFLFV